MRTALRIVVPIKQVPDLVEVLELLPDGTDIDREFLTFLTNEFDEQALEQALLIREAVGGEVVVVGLDDPDVDRALFTALAKGADRAVKLVGLGDGWVDTHARAAAFAAWLRGQGFDLVLTGVQAADDLDGQLPPLLGVLLGLPHASVVVGVEVAGGVARVRQDCSAGRVAELELRLPAVLGIQAASQPPRYASITRIRQATQAGGIEEEPAAAPAAAGGITVRRLYAPERAGRAELLDGDVEAVAERIVEVLRSRGLMKG